MGACVQCACALSFAFHSTITCACARSCVFPPLGTFTAKEFAKRLWGNVFLSSNRAFKKKPENADHKRTFVQFILEPLYKVTRFSVRTYVCLCFPHSKPAPILLLRG